MADDAKWLGSVQILPDEITKIISNCNNNYAPSSTNAGDKWYYRITDITVDDEDLIKNGDAFLQGQGNSGAGTDTGGTQATIDGSADKVKWLFIQHTGLRDDGSTSNTDDVYITLDGNTGDTTTATDAIILSNGDTLVLKLNCVTNDLHVEANSSNKVRCIVAALINDAA
tara:strand:+ start:32 stop:541 length:510 start_codon:yes stop_codon:yes gene_type:complete